MTIHLSQVCIEITWYVKFLTLLWLGPRPYSRKGKNAETVVLNKYRASIDELRRRADELEYRIHNGDTSALYEEEVDAHIHRGRSMWLFFFTKHVTEELYLQRT